MSSLPRLPITRGTATTATTTAITTTAAVSAAKATAPAPLDRARLGLARQSLGVHQRVDNDDANEKDGVHRLVQRFQAREHPDFNVLLIVLLAWGSCFGLG